MIDPQTPRSQRELLHVWIYPHDSAMYIHNGPILNGLGLITRFMFRVNGPCHFVDKQHGADPERAQLERCRGAPVRGPADRCGLPRTGKTSPTRCPRLLLTFGTCSRPSSRTSPSMNLESLPCLPRVTAATMARYPPTMSRSRMRKFRTALLLAQVSLVSSCAMSCERYSAH